MVCSKASSVMDGSSKPRSSVGLGMLLISVWKLGLYNAKSISLIQQGFENYLKNGRNNTICTVVIVFQKDMVDRN